MFRDGTPVTPRHVLALLRYLPEGSAYVAELLGGQHMRSWTTPVEIAAQTRDATGTGGYKSKLPRPEQPHRVATLDEALPI
ncbi:hypothetical protein ACVDFE_02095 [Lentzea chajnantorensis]